MELWLHTSPLAQWYELIIRAERRAGIALDKNLESYLISTAMQVMTHPHDLQPKLYGQFFEALQAPPHQAVEQLRSLGDRCLTFVGWFPEYLESKYASSLPVMQLGQQAYWQRYLKKPQDRLFETLAHEFEPLCQVLQAARGIQKDLFHPTSHKHMPQGGAANASFIC